MPNITQELDIFRMMREQECQEIDFEMEDGLKFKFIRMSKDDILFDELNEDTLNLETISILRQMKQSQKLLQQEMKAKWTTRNMARQR